MRRLFNLIWLLLFCLGTLAAVTPAPAEKRIAFTLQGRVENSVGKGVPGARVILLRAGGTSAARQTRTDASGEWRFTQVKPGKWRLQALGRDALSEIYHVVISWRRERQALMPVVLQLRVNSTDVLAEGKTHLYSHDWEAGLRALDFFCINFTESPLLEEAMFWKAYACFRMARKNQAADGSGSADLRQHALTLIGNLLKRFHGGPWSDDARVLRLDVWCDQIRAGERKNPLPLMNATKPDLESDPRVRRAAIEILIPMRPDFAWESLLREFKVTQKPKLRRDLLVLITHFRQGRAIPELRRIARVDPDPLVRAGAEYWLQRVDRQGGEVNLP